jgi:hypothetical protein
MMRRLILIALALLCHSTVWAHKASDSYLVVDAKGATVSVQWDIALRDIDFAIGLDANGNGEITWGELRSRQSPPGSLGSEQPGHPAGRRLAPCK